MNYNFKRKIFQTQVNQVVIQEVIKTRALHLQKKERQLPIQRWKLGASLVAQWLRIRLPMQGTRV